MSFFNQAYFLLLEKEFDVGEEAVMGSRVLSQGKLPALSGSLTLYLYRQLVELFVPLQCIDWFPEEEVDARLCHPEI